MQEAGIEKEWVKGISHSDLFFCFKDTLESIVDLSAASQKTKETVRKRKAGQRFSLTVLNFLINKETSEAAVIGAISIGVQGLSKTIYSKLQKGVMISIPSLTTKDLAFFELQKIIAGSNGDNLHSIASQISAGD